MKKNKSKQEQRIDSIVDIICLAMMIFAIIVVIADPIVKFVLVLMGCGAMYNNVKYVIQPSKKKKAKKDKKQKKEEKEIEKENK